jgi:predicted amidohydrolase
MPNRTVRVASVCLLDDDRHRTREYVLDQLASACKSAKRDLVVAPYMPFLSFGERDEQEDLAPFAALAKRHKTYLAVALTEEAGGRECATSVLFDRQGKLAFKWRKTHAFPDDDIALGDELDVFETDFGKIGATIGTDIYFPEIYEVLRMKAADILIWHHFPERFRDDSGLDAILNARAFDSHAHFVASMYADPRTYITNRYEIGMQGAAWGRSMVLNRVGVPIADTGYEDGIAAATIDLDKRKADPYDHVKNEACFFVNNFGDRKAFHPVAEAWQPPQLPGYAKRTARVAVIYMWINHMWATGKLPERMLELIDEAAQFGPDLILLSEMSAGIDDEVGKQACDEIARRARDRGMYICIGGVRDKEKTSHAFVWDREGEIIFRQPIYWTKGYPEINVFDTDFARVGTHLCGDLYVPWVDRVSALKGAELILDPSQMWGASGWTNETLLRARAIDNGVWVACAHWNSSDASLRSVIVDPYGKVVAASQFQREGIIHVDIDFDDRKVYYEGRKAQQPKRGEKDIPSYFTEDIPEQKPGWRGMVFPRRRPELYGIIPTVNDVILKYRP